jgi:hypothetical protein
MKFVKNAPTELRENLLGLLGIIAIFFIVVGPLSFMVYMASTATDRRALREASLESYKYVASMYEDLPELRDEIQQYKEDGILTNGEVKTLETRAERIRKDREMEKIK